MQKHLDPCLQCRWKKLEWLLVNAKLQPHPNVIRIFQGTVEESEADFEDIYLVNRMLMKQSSILAFFMEKAFAQGALDVFFTPIFMKKNRPGVRLSLLAPASKLEELNRLFFSETTAIGLRYWKIQTAEIRTEMEAGKNWKTPVKIKESFLDGKTL